MMRCTYGLDRAALPAATAPAPAFAACFFFDAMALLGSAPCGETYPERANRTGGRAGKAPRERLKATAGKAPSAAWRRPARAADGAQGWGAGARGARPRAPRRGRGRRCR